MKLHRTTGRPDWEAIEPPQYNSWQRLAAASGGLVTPGNIITAAGLIIVLAALALLLQGHGWLAVAGLALGRALDVADGLAAEATRTKSPLGEAMDATADKLGTGLTLAAAGVSGTVSWLMVSLLALPHLLIAGIVLTALRGGRKFHPSRFGKLSMAAAWLGLLCLIAVNAAGYRADSAIGLLAYGLSGISLVMGLIAAIGYSQDIK
ncbi:MAG: hypothetical protein NVSMB39_2640 [Candidatus Saccharimonadales bacterium]